MATLDKVIKRLENLQRPFLQAVLRVIKEQEHIALDLITQEQLFKRGIRGDGQDLGEYAPFTIIQKKAKGLPYDHVTLFDEGDFHEGFFANAEQFPVTFFSTDQKADMLADKYGDEITELTKNNIGEFLEQISPYVSEEIFEEIKKAFR